MTHQISVVSARPERPGWEGPFVATCSCGWRSAEQPRRSAAIRSGGGHKRAALHKRATS